MSQINVVLGEESSGIAVPDTGALTATGISNAGIMGGGALLLLFSAIALAAVIITRKRSYRTFSAGEKGSMKIHSKVKTIAGLSVIAIIFTALAVPAINNTASEPESVSAIGAASNTLSISSEDITLTARPTADGTFATVEDTITINTATEAGYTLSVYTSNANLVSSENADHYISGLTSSTDAVVLGNNTWGIAKTAAENKDSAVWYGIPAESNPLIIANPTTATAASDTTKVYYGINVNTDLPDGTYSGTINYVAVANIVPERTSYMQDITSAELATMMPNSGNTATLTDSRDNQEYTIANINGIYWMTKNLNLAGGTTLTPESSNVSTNYALPKSSPDGFSDSSTAYVYNSGSTTCGETSPCYSYYNYVAATASTNPSSGYFGYDICPAGWRLPTHAEFRALRSNYSTGNALTSGPFHAVYSGVYSIIYAGGGPETISFNDGGSLGYYWSSTAIDSSNAYSLGFNSTGAGLGTTDRNLLLPVRCVAKQSAPIPSVSYMQNITSAELAAMMPSSGNTATLTDSRDNQEYTVANISGTYWMTKNLNLAGGTTLTPVDSNVASNYTLPASQVITEGTTLDGGFYNEDTAYVFNSGSTTCGDSSPCYSYYSYVAANAGANPSNDSTNHDICPAGWRMPTSADFNTLVGVYTTGNALTASPFNAVYNGSYSGATFYNGGEYGNYWSSTASSGWFAYSLYFGNSSPIIDPTAKGRGYAVRCVADI